MNRGREVRCCPACGAVYRAEFPRCVNDGAELVLLDRDPLVGAPVGPYVVDELLGEGGMGRVYRVHHARLTQKRYALKILLGDLAATPPMRMRFAKEAQSASRLAHPNVVAVTDFGVTDKGLAYLAMDLVVGTPLSDLIGAPMAPDRVIRLARQLCAGLAHAHDLGLVHRDFKPDNILVVDTSSGEVPRIADFGLAITADPDAATEPRLTTSGIVMGTPGYIAPEQCIAGPIDHRADLYALGATMFELLTGGFLPFDGDAAEIVGLKTTTVAPTIAERAPHVTVSPALSAVVDSLLARLPEHRYRDARAVIAALDDAVRHPDDAELARGATAPRTDDTPVKPVRHRAPRVEDLPGKRTTPLSQRAKRAPTAKVQRPRSFAGVAIAFGAIALAAIAAISAVVIERSRPNVTPVRLTGDGAIAAVRPSTDERPATDGRARGGSGQPAARATPDRAGASELAAPARTTPGAAPAEDARPRPEGDARVLIDRPRTSKRTVKPRPKRTAASAPPPPATAPRTEPPAAAPRIEPVAPPTRSPPVVEAMPPPDVPAPPPPPPPVVSLAPRLATLDVQGALPNAAVRRAIDRVLPAMRSCRSAQAGAVDLRFSIGESRRPAAIRATGLASASCLAGALAALRAESAPDVGDVDVHARFTYDP